jgi:hypothetical protein
MIEVVIDILGYLVVGIAGLAVLFWILHAVFRTPLGQGIFKVETNLCTSREFSQNEWLAHPETDSDGWINGARVCTVRKQMLDDLVENVLRPGLNRETLRSMLGEPYNGHVPANVRKQLVGEMVASRAESNYAFYLVESWQGRSNWLVVEFDEGGILNRSWTTTASA